MLQFHVNHDISPSEGNPTKLSFFWEIRLCFQEPSFTLRFFVNTKTCQTSIKKSPGWCQDNAVPTQNHLKKFPSKTLCIFSPPQTKKYILYTCISKTKQVFFIKKIRYVLSKKHLGWKCRPLSTVLLLNYVRIWIWSLRNQSENLHTHTKSKKHSCKMLKLNGAFWRDNFFFFFFFFFFFVNCKWATKNVRPDTFYEILVIQWFGLCNNPHITG